jgi:hypothetical protein
MLGQVVQAQQAPILGDDIHDRLGHPACVEGIFAACADVAKGLGDGGVAEDLADARRVARGRGQQL